MAGGLPNGGGRPPAPEEMLNEIFARLRSARGNSPIALIVLALAAAAWLATGFYQINPSEVGVVTRFGAVRQTTPPGLHWKAPRPIDHVYKVPVARVLKEEIGFETISVGPPARYRDKIHESRMLTSDGNIVDLDFIVQYTISDPVKYLFNVRGQTETLHDLSEAAMRRVVGRTTITDTLTEGRLEIQTRAQQLLQEYLDHYDSGVHINTVKLQDVVPPAPVQDAFKDVINAEQDKERMINEAEGFANDILPKARGRAAQMLNQAEGYAESKVKEADGDAQRFTLLDDAYRLSPKVTRKRLYLETMERVLSGANKVLLDQNAAGGTLPLLSLDRLLERSRTTAGQSAAGTKSASAASTGAVAGTGTAPTAPASETTGLGESHSARRGGAR